MTYTDMAVELEKLPLVERLALIERLTHSVREEIASSAEPPDTQPEMAAIQPKPGSSLSRVLGMLRPDGPMPTDEELKEDYTNYLIRKYL
jgi:hypothetical protein